MARNNFRVHHCKDGIESEIGPALFCVFRKPCSAVCVQVRWEWSIWYNQYWGFQLSVSRARGQGSWGAHKGFPGGANGKEPTCHCRKHKRCRFDPWVGKIPWRKAWQPTLVFLPDRGAWWAIIHRVAKSQTQLHVSELGRGSTLHQPILLKRCWRLGSGKMQPLLFILRSVGQLK